MKVRCHKTDAQKRWKDTWELESEKESVGEELRLTLGLEQSIGVERGQGLGSQEGSKKQELIPLP